MNSSILEKLNDKEDAQSNVSFGQKSAIPPKNEKFNAPYEKSETRSFNTGY